MGAKAEKLVNTFTDIIKYGLLFLLSLVIVSPMIGSVYVFFDWYWGKVALVINLLLACVLACYIYKIGMLQIENMKESLVLLVIMTVCFGLYSQYSPVLEIMQDPSLYMFRALNLVNYGHRYKPMLVYNDLIANGIINLKNGYAAIQNGTYFQAPVLQTDFFPGGSFFYSLFGLLSKKLIFFGQTAIMVINSWLMYFALKKVSKVRNFFALGLYTLTFMVAPLIVWFGRGSFAEPVALVFLLLIINLLTTDKCPPILLAICFLASYSARIDYFIILLMGLFIIMYINLKVGIVYTVAVVGQIFLYQNVYECYFSRIADDLILFKYQIPLVVVFFIISFLLLKWQRDLLPKVLYSKWVKFLVIGIGFICVCLMFYDNIVPKDFYEIALIHKQMLRTYREECLDLLFLVFPSIILCLGLMGMYKFIDKERVNFITSIFLLGVGVIYLYLLFGGANSPMLYWLLRRYYNNIVPISLLSFCCLFSSLHKNQEYLLAVTCMFLSLNLYLNSGQIIDYEGLDTSVSKMEHEIKAQGYETVYYPMYLKREISPLFSYSDLEFVPIDFNEYRVLKERRNEFDLSDSIILANDIDVIKDMDAYTYEMSYIKLGEAYGEIPKEVYEKSMMIRGYELKEYMGNGENGCIYPAGFIKSITGMYDDGWTSSKAQITFDGLNIENDSELVVELKKFNNYFITNGNMEELDLEVIVNDNYCLELINYDGNSFYFALDKLKESGEDLNKIMISSNTFSPFEKGIAKDARKIGIAVEEIYVQ